MAEETNKDVGSKKIANHTSKDKLEDFSLDEMRGLAIDLLNQIDNRLNNLIINQFKPQHKSEFERIILNNSIIDIGGKIKILQNISDIDKKTIEALRRLSSIRNGFAHAKSSLHFSFVIGKEDSISPDLKIEVMNAQGKLDFKEPLNYITEFTKLYEEVGEALKKVNLLFDSE